jgi:hypothetical protein
LANKQLERKIIMEVLKPEEVGNKALSIVDQSKMVKVVDSETYTAAGGLWKSLGDMIKEVKDTFDPICEKAFAAHKEATGKRALYLDPLVAAQKSVKGLMSAYDAEQERIRKAEEARLAEIARKEEEDRRLQEAIEAEEEAKRNGATVEEAAQVSQEIIEEPVYVAPVVVPKSVPKMAGGPIYSTRWYAEVVDIKALCTAVGTGKTNPEYVMGLERDKETGKIRSSILDKMAPTAKDAFPIAPGVKAYSKRV